MEKASCDVVILSDLHLGSDISRASEALELLQSLRFRRLILLGDIFCDLNFRRLKREHWQFLSHIRKLSNPKRGSEVIWIEGNHDYGLADVMSHLVGVPVYKEFVWDSAGRRNLAIHGHQFDRLVLNNHYLITGLIGNLYLSIQKLSSKGLIVARLLDRLNTRWQRLTPKVAQGALAYARSRGASSVFCGHTHQAFAMAKDGISYYNAGAWTNGCPSYITIQGREVSINEYIGRIDHCHTCEERGEIASAAFDVATQSRLPFDVEYENSFG
jgi:UDP-2,3-diacylglucosamine pyrophosphatase LpxH